MPDPKLSASLATDFARMLHGALPRIEYLLDAGATQARFTMTATFLKTKKGVTVKLTGQESLQAPMVEHKLVEHDGQLSLFHGEKA